MGVGFTVRVNDCAVPGQEFAPGVTLNMAIAGDVPALAPVKEDMFPVPEAELKPMAVLLLVQE